MREPIVGAATPRIALYQPNGRATLGDLHAAARLIDPSIPANFNTAMRNGDPDDWQRLIEGDPPRNAPPGASRVGGAPDLPQAVPWPRVHGRRLPFLVQLDCAALPRWHGSPLPADGWLWFFAGGDFPIATAIRHWRGEADALVRHAPPDADDALVSEYVDAPAFTWRPIVDAAVVASVPRYGSAAFDRIAATGDDEAHDTTNGLIDLADALDRVPGKDHESIVATLLGHLDDADEPSAIARYGNREGTDWTTLLQLHSAGSMCWGDSGTLAFLMRDAALRAGDFSDVYTAMISS